MRLLGYTTFAYYMASLWTSVQDIGFPCLLTLQLINKNKNRVRTQTKTLEGLDIARMEVGTFRCKSKAEFKYGISDQVKTMDI